MNFFAEFTAKQLGEWAGPDSDRRPSARQADVLTRLDDRPTYAYFLVFPDIGFVFLFCDAYSKFSLLLIYFLTSHTAASKIAAEACSSHC